MKFFAIKVGKIILTFSFLVFIGTLGALLTTQLAVALAYSAGYGIFSDIVKVNFCAWIVGGIVLLCFNFDRFSTFVIDNFIKLKETKEGNEVKHNEESIQ